MRQALLALVAIGLVASLAGAGTMAYFNDTETSEGNTFTAGTLDLKVDGRDDPLPVKISVNDVAPGLSSPKWSSNYTWYLKNVGTIKDVKAQMHIVVTKNLENGYTEPEAAVDNTPEGELAGVLMVEIIFNGGFVTRGYLADLNCKDIHFPPWESDWASNTVKLKCSIDSEVGNEIQSDIVEFDIVFRLEQA
ncbi:unnamed protein product [marine sediment metagenome]|uniref:Uncharacterized protein n=1 Tax=marine sediment metagenome TaxID=412755 RepID=X1MY06_9ZZZZ